MNRNQLRLLRLEAKVPDLVIVIDETCDSDLTASEIEELKKHPGTIIRLIDEIIPYPIHAEH